KIPDHNPERQQDRNRGQKKYHPMEHGVNSYIVGIILPFFSGHVRFLSETYTRLRLLAPSLICQPASGDLLFVRARQSAHSVVLCLRLKHLHRQPEFLRMVFLKKLKSELLSAAKSECRPCATHRSH